MAKHGQNYRLIQHKASKFVLLSNQPHTQQWNIILHSGLSSDLMYENYSEKLGGNWMPIRGYWKWLCFPKSFLLQFLPT